ncbi:SCO family protein [Oxalobacteraceae bacterium OTU3CINTB1]|nr:SCO family protein [Oxalobacteraceae bacterium OTU3CINTB1]
MKKILALGLLAVSLMLAGCGEKTAPAPTFKNVDITGATFARDFALTDHTGKPRTLADYKGKVVVMFFGFTQCPDVCPTTMAEMSAVMKELGPQAGQVQVLFVTVDPERDTKELLSQYVPAFDKRFVGLYGTPEQTAATAKEFKVFYAKVEGKTPGSYSIDHTAASYIFDRNGKVRLLVRHNQGPAPIVHDIKQLLQ